MIQPSAGSTRELTLINEVRHYQAEEEYFHLKEQRYEHQGRLQKQMIVCVQQQANIHTYRVQKEARGFQCAVQDNAEAVISQRANQKVANFRSILNTNIQQMDAE
eukprot:327384-Amphidinium_carterae.1